MNNKLHISILALISCVLSVASLALIQKPAQAAIEGVIISQPTISVEGESIVEIKNVSSEEWLASVAKQSLSDGDSVRTEDNASAIIVFPSGASARLNSKTEAVINSSEIKLINGEIWVDAQIASSKFVVNFDKFNVTGDGSIFDISTYNGGILRVVAGDVQAMPSSSFVNIGNQIAFSTNVVSRLDNGWMAEDWYSANAGKDENDRANKANNLKDKIEENGSHNISDILLDLRGKLTFFDEKKKDLYLSFVSDIIDNGVYYFSVDDKRNGEDAFIKALNFVKGLDSACIPDLKNLLSDKFKELKIFTKKEGNIYIAKNELRDLILGYPVANSLSPEEKIYFVRSFLYEAMADNMNPDSNKLISAYFENLFRAAMANKKAFAKYLTEDNRLIYNVLIDNPLFYRESNFASKVKLEKMIGFLDKKDAAAEKLEFLKNLKDFTLKDEFSVKDAKEISDFLRENIGTDTGFDSELAKFDDFFAFLGDEKYANSIVYGNTPSERFIAYLNVQRDKKQIEELKKTLETKPIESGSKQTAETFDDIKKAVSAKFEAHGVKIEEFGDVNGENMKYISIKKAANDNLEFSAKYNRFADTVFEIKTDDGREFPFGVKIDRLEQALAVIVLGGSRASAPALSGTELPEAMETSEFEVSAKALIVKKLFEFGIKVSTNQIFTVNLITKEFKISGAEITAEKGEKILINFNFKDPFTDATDIELKGKKGLYPYADKTVSLQSLVPEMLSFSEKIYYQELDQEIKDLNK